MKKKIFVLTLALMLVFGFSGEVYAVSGTIDQSNDGAWQIGQNIQYYQPIGQEFVPSKSFISGVEVSITSGIKQGPVDLTLIIHQSTITGPIIASKTVSPVGQIYHDWLMFEFSSPVSVTPGSVYVIEIQSNSQEYLVLFTTDAYALGNSVISGIDNIYLDILFRTYAPSNCISPMAAPNIAEIILNEADVSPNQSIGQGKDKVKLNLISEVAHNMGNQTMFDGIEMTIVEDGIEVCNPAYWDAVLTFLNGYGFDFDYSLNDYMVDQP